LRISKRPSIIWPGSTIIVLKEISIAGLIPYLILLVCFVFLFLQTEFNSVDPFERTFWGEIAWVKEWASLRIEFMDRMVCYSQNNSQFNQRGGLCDDENYCTYDFCNAENATCEHVDNPHCLPECGNYRFDNNTCFNPDESCFGKCNQGECLCPFQVKSASQRKADLLVYIIPSIVTGLVLIVLIAIIGFLVYRKYAMRLSDSDNLLEDNPLVGGG
jgi:hypothetical protein